MFTFSKTRYLVYTALFCALAVIVKRFSSFVILGGAGKISLFCVPVFLAGLMLGPICGAVTGAVGDILGSILLSYSIAPLLSFNFALMGAVMGLCTYRIKSIKYLWLRAVIAGVFIYAVCTMGIGTLAQTLPPTMYYDTFTAAFMVRLPVQWINSAINLALTIALFYALIPLTKILKWQTKYPQE